ncbi:TerL, partial [bacterium]|nr:TerL [bacterium]
MSEQKSLDINYKAENTPAKFHGADDFVRGIMGPVGSGKSVACCIELVSRAMQQEPGFDGVRRFRAAAIRNSYPELKTTTIKTWQDWFPDSICSMNWGSPITGTIRCAAPPTEKFPQGTMLEFEIWFLALDRPKDVKKLLSMELTMAWINEAR